MGAGRKISWQWSHFCSSSRCWELSHGNYELNADNMRRNQCQTVSLFKTYTTIYKLCKCEPGCIRPRTNHPLSDPVEDELQTCSTLMVLHGGSLRPAMTVEETAVPAPPPPTSLPPATPQTAFGDSGSSPVQSASSTMSMSAAPATTSPPPQAFAASSTSLFTPPSSTPPKKKFNPL